MLRAFYVTDEVRVEDGRLMMQVPEQGRRNLVGMKVDFDIKGRGAEPIVRSGKKVTHTALEGSAQGRTSAKSRSSLSSSKAPTPSADIVNKETGEVILEANNEITSGEAAGDRRSRHRQFLSLLPGARRHRRDSFADAEEGRRSPSRSMRCSRFIARCVPAIRRRCRPPTVCSKACSSIRASLISRASAV